MCKAHPQAAAQDSTSFQQKDVESPPLPHRCQRGIRKRARRGGIASRGCYHTRRQAESDQFWQNWSLSQKRRLLRLHTVNLTFEINIIRSARNDRNGLFPRKGPFWHFLPGSSKLRPWFFMSLRDMKESAETSLLDSFHFLSKAQAGHRKLTGIGGIPWNSINSTPRTTPPHVCPLRPPLRTWCTPPTTYVDHHDAHRYPAALPHRTPCHGIMDSIDNPMESMLWTLDMRSWTSDMRYLNLRYEYLNLRYEVFELRYEVLKPQIWDT